MREPLKVIHVIGGGEFGGAEQHILELLARFPAGEIDPKVIAFYDARFAQTLRERGVKVHVVKGIRRFDLRLLTALKRLFLAERPHIIHTHGVKANFFGRLAARWSGFPRLVTTVHSVLRYDYPHPVAYTLASWMDRSTRRFSLRFIAISGAVRDYLLREGVPPERIRLVHHGIDASRFYRPEAREEVRTQWGLGGEHFAVGMVGRLVKVKGAEVFVDAAAALARRHDDARFVLVGDGPERAAIEEHIRRLGLEDRFVLAGFRQDIPECLAALDCFVSASFFEGLGLSVLEAMAAGVPVVATAVGGVLDFLSDGENGLLVPAGDPERLAGALAAMIEDPALRCRLVARARADVVEKFSFDRMAAETAAVYRELLSSSGNSRMA